MPNIQNTSQKKKEPIPQYTRMGTLKRGTAMLHLNFEGRRKPECTDVVIAAHAMRENHYATLVHSFENFLRSQNYKISITLLLY